MKYLYMLVGLPLTGKTTFRKRMFPHFAGIVISSDDLLMALADLNKLTYNEAFQAVGDRINQAAFDLGKYSAQRTVSVVWDQTNLTRKSRAKKLALFPEYYYKVAYVFPTPPTDILVQRQGNPDREGKFIPLTVLDDMRASYESPDIDEGFNEIRFVNGDLTIGIEHD